jgi:hypothetical protein
MSRSALDRNEAKQWQMMQQMQAAQAQIDAEMASEYSGGSSNQIPTCVFSFSIVVFIAINAFERRWGNSKFYNINALLAQNIMQAEYFRDLL